MTTPTRHAENDNIQCPVCGYFCVGKGGVGCIDKPTLCGLSTTPSCPSCATMDAQLYRLGDELAQAHLEIQKNDTEIGHLTKIVDEQANAIQTLEAATRRVVEAAVMAGELFQDIRNDYTDPRSECREGMRILKDSLADPILVALRREL